MDQHMADFLLHKSHAFPPRLLVCNGPLVPFDFILTLILKDTGAKEVIAHSATILVENTDTNT